MQGDLFSFVPVPQLPLDHAEVYRLISAHRGAKNGITQATLAEITGFSSRSVRQICKEIVEDYRLPVGSGATGFYLPITKAEAQHILHDLHSRENSIRERRLALSQVFAPLFGQLSLEDCHA